MKTITYKQITRNLMEIEEKMIEKHFSLNKNKKIHFLVKTNSLLVFDLFQSFSNDFFKPFLL